MSFKEAFVFVVVVVFVISFVRARLFILFEINCKNLLSLSRHQILLKLIWFFGSFRFFSSYRNEKNYFIYECVKDLGIYFGKDRNKCLDLNHNNRIDNCQRLLDKLKQRGLTFYEKKSRH